MKKGFALLETLIVITFLCVSLLLLYGTFSNMISNSKKNILYDDASNIYKTYYLKEYLTLNDLNSKLSMKKIIELDCNDFNFDSCTKIFNIWNIEKIYITAYDLKEYPKEEYSSTFNNYLNVLSNKENYLYRFIVEFNNENTYSYASIGFGDING